MTRLAPALCLLLPACTGLSPTEIYAGPQTPLAGTCNPASQATLTRRGNEFVLAPGNGTLTLQGSLIAQAGAKTLRAGNGTLTLQGSLIGPTLTLQTTLAGADKKPYPILFTGQLSANAINGTLTTPRCRYALALKLTGD